MTDIRVPNTKIDYSDPTKAIKQLENNFNSLKDAVSFTLESIDISNIVFADGSSVTNKESLIGPQGVPGVNGKDGKDGVDGVDGADGFSPTITVKTNTDTEYVLTITTAEGSFDTPNLKGGTSSGTTSE